MGGTACGSDLISCREDSTDSLNVTVFITAHGSFACLVKSAIGKRDLQGIRQRGQLSSDFPPAVTNDRAAKGGDVRTGAENARAPGGFNTAYTRRIAVYNNL